MQTNPAVEQNKNVKWSESLWNQSSSHVSPYSASLGCWNLWPVFTIVESYWVADVENLWS